MNYKANLVYASDYFIDDADEYLENIRIFKRCFFDLQVTKAALFLEITSRSDSSESAQYELSKVERVE